MFDSLSEKLGGILDRLTRRGALSEANVEAALRAVRRALLEADVALDVARAFVEQVKERAVGVDVIKSVTPARWWSRSCMTLVGTLGSDLIRSIQRAGAGRNHDGRPARLGQNHHDGKIGKRITEQMKRKVLMASLDTRRPAAWSSLRCSARKGRCDITNRRTVTGPDRQSRVVGCKARRLRRRAARHRGPHHADEAMMNEAAEVSARPRHTRCCSSPTASPARTRSILRAHSTSAGLTGIVLTRIDGDGRGGAALSMRAVTGKPIKLLGTGEKWMRWRIFIRAHRGPHLGMGDIVSLVEKAAANIDHEQAMRAAERMRKGAFDLADLREQLTGMQKMGGMSGLMSMLPGIAKMKNRPRGA
jgi:signal recognition particle subunit SRP54